MPSVFKKFKTGFELNKGKGKNMNVTKIRFWGKQFRKWKNRMSTWEWICDWFLLHIHKFYDLWSEYSFIFKNNQYIEFGRVWLDIIIIIFALYFIRKLAVVSDVNFYCSVCTFCGFLTKVWHMHVKIWKQFSKTAFLFFLYSSKIIL